MPRPREFDYDEALDAMMQVFWDHGYESTTIAHLVEGSGVQRASLYRVFGDKSAIFGACIDRYGEWRKSRLTPGKPIDLLRQWLQFAVDDATNGVHPRGCLLILSTGQLTSLPDERRTQVEGHLDGLRTFFRWCLTDQIAPEQVADHAESIIAANIGLFVMSRAGSSPERLQSIVDHTLRGILLARKAVSSSS